MHQPLSKIGAMAKPRGLPIPTLFLQEWLDATGRDQKGAAAAAGVDPSYIANLIAGRKKRPSTRIMLDISIYIGCTINDLFRPPPSAEALAAISTLSPTTRENLLSATRPKRSQ